MKRFNFNLDARDVSTFFLPIREKRDILLLLMKSIKRMLLNTAVNQEDVRGEMVLLVDKMSRLFYFTDNKYYSINFPFTVIEEPEGLVFSSKYIESIDHKITSDFIELLNSEGFNNSSCVYTFNDHIAELEEGQTGFWSLVKELLLFEDGYLRYDYDEKRANKRIHPLNHIDIFYSNGPTFKVGINDRISKKSLMDLLNVLTDCHYLDTIG